MGLQCCRMISRLSGAEDPRSASMLVGTVSSPIFFLSAFSGCRGPEETLGEWIYAPRHCLVSCINRVECFTHTHTHTHTHAHTHTHTHRHTQAHTGTHTHTHKHTHTHTHTQAHKLPRSLVHVHLSNNRVTHKSAEGLAAGLQHCVFLQVSVKVRVCECLQVCQKRPRSVSKET